jgi:hypothetical protein
MTLQACTDIRGFADILERELAVETHEDVLLVPLGGFGSSGLFDKRGRLIKSAGYFRGSPEIHLPIESETTPLEAETFELADPSPDYFYVGHLTGHYGHFLFAALARLWALRHLRNSRTKFVVLNSHEVEELCRLDFVAKIFDSLGLRPDDLSVFQRPTRIARIAVAEPSVQECIWGHRLYAEMCHQVGRSVTGGLAPAPSDIPVFISRMRLTSGVHRIVNEGIFCEHLERRGIQIVFPETLPFEQQVQMFLERDCIAGMAGSAMHTSIFAPNRRLFILNHMNWIMANQTIIDRLNDNTAIQLYPAGDIVREGQDGSFQHRWRLLDPARTADELLRVLDGCLYPATAKANGNSGTMADTQNEAPTPIHLGAHVQGLGDCWFRPGEWAGDRGSGRWLEGIIVSSGPEVAADEVEYAAIGEGGALSDWVTGGEFCGSRGQDRPLQGLRFRLHGLAAASYELVCSATFIDGSAVGPMCGTDLSCWTHRLAPLEAIQLELRRSSAQTTSPSAEGGILPADGDAAGLALPELAGESYFSLLARLHKVLQPRTYFEIGTLRGESLALSRSASVAVDPRFVISKDVIGDKPFCLFYQMPSDRFFETLALKTVLGGPVDLAFLDGMHLFEFLLRDFINVEENSRPNSVICLHDCIPTDVYMTVREESDPARSRSRHPVWWTGDVWKVVVILQRHRPDLKVYSFDAGPTGLVAITNLDPSSRVLRENYFSITEEFRDRDLATYGIEGYFASLRIISTGSVQKAADIFKYFWL